ncbi:MAG: hypothetical protein JW384_03192 [Nitrosomonadaceae bacterium]|nr:hypothetical protein [Nitrosomonadaceae bacterium]
MQVSHVAVLGVRPAEEVERRIKRILSAGIATTLPDDILQLLAQRRTAAAKLGPWVERHYRPGEPSA